MNWTSIRMLKGICVLLTFCHLTFCNGESIDNCNDETISLKSWQNKKIVSAAAQYCQDSYGNSPKVTDFDGTKCYLEFIETSGILYIAFRGSADIDDALSDLDEKLIDQKGNKKAFIY